MGQVPEHRREGAFFGSPHPTLCHCLQPTSHTLLPPPPPCSPTTLSSPQVRFLADTHGELAKALGIELDASAVLGNVRCKRFAAIVDDGKVSGHAAPTAQAAQTGG